jgi:hypothetical protein
MPGINAKSSTIIPRNRPYPPDGRNAARAIRALKIPGGEAIAGGFDSLSDSVLTLQKAARENAPAIETFTVTDEQTGRVLAVLGEYEYQGIVYSGGYFSELHAGDPYGTGDPSLAILNVTTDGKVQVGQNGWIDVLDPFSESAAWIGTQADRLAVTGAVNNGSGLIRLTVTAHTLATGDSVRVWEVGGVPNATGVFTVTNIGANTIDLQNSVFVGTYTSGGYVNRLLHITGAANNGAGLIRLTIVAHGYESGDKVNVASVGGVPNASGQHIISVISANTFDLVGSTWGGAYTSGGICLRYFAGGLFQTVAIGESFADYKARMFADGSLKIRNATITLTGASSQIVLDPTTGSITVSDYPGPGFVTEIFEGFIRIYDSATVDEQSIFEPGFTQMYRDGLTTIFLSAMLDIHGRTGSSAFGPTISLNQARGTVAVPTTTQSGDTLGGLLCTGYDGISNDYAGAIRAVATENFNLGHGTELVLDVTPSGATTSVTAVTIDGLGVEIADTLGIGTPPVSQRGIDFGGTITAVANEARGIRVGNGLTLAASADSDLLAGILVNPVFDAGAFAGVTKYGIYASTTEPNYFAGDLILGAKATTYNNAVTEGIGAVPVYASVALTNQSASIGATNLQVGGAVAPVGQYRVSWHTATRTAGAGSVLVTLGWNDGISAKTITGTINLTAGAFQTIITPIIHADGTNNITYATTYAATGAYDIYVTLERLA